ncbi:MAG: hypothetical protein R3D84_10830 [Paracoccaceae bacterium]
MQFPILAAAVAAFCLAQPVTAQTISQRGGSVITKKIGPWYIERTHYEDGSAVCWSHNLNYGRSAPLFSFLAARGGKDPGSGLRFAAVKPAKPGDTVKLVANDAAVTLTHTGTGAEKVFSIADGKAGGTIIRLLLETETGRNKSFWVVDKDGTKYKFDARSTSKMLLYLKETCGFGE